MTETSAPPVSIVEFLTARECSADGCDRTGKLVRGMCGRHYRNWLDRTPPAQRPPAPRFTRSFWDFVDKSGDCWLWTGPVDKKGYGRWAANRKKGLAHRYSLDLAITCPDEQLMACHHCDNPPCVNPAHLYWGTAADNARDAVERGQHYVPPPKERCINGHDLDGNNVAVYSGRRNCRTCMNERAEVKATRNRAAAYAAGETLAAKAAAFKASSPQELLTVAEASQRFGISADRLRYQIRAKRLTVYGLSWMYKWIDADEVRRIA